MSVTWRLVQADCIEAMRKMDPASIDAIVTDPLPPYGLEFMGKEWDRLQAPGRDDLRHKRRMDVAPEPERGNPWASERKSYGTVKKNPRCRRCSRLRFDHEPRRCRCESPDWDLRIAESARVMQQWHHLWATEALRVLKPGAHLLAFGGSRTFHRLTCALEDAGFEIRDCLSWLYGSGFPKSLDVSKAIDKARKDEPEWRRVGAWLKAQREAAGHTRQSLAPLLSAHKNLDSAAANLSNWENGLSFPTWERWEELRSLLGFGDEMDAEVWRLNGRKGKPGEAWEQREVVGIETTPWKVDEAVKRTTSYNPTGSTIDEDGYRYTVHTAPATEEAQRWQGWGTALKPAWEPVILARKPLAERNVAANVTRFGTGALNIDGARIETDGRPHREARKAQENEWEGGGQWKSSGFGEGETTLGRWPPNVALDEQAAAMLDEQSGELGTGWSGRNRGWQRGAYVGGRSGIDQGLPEMGYGDTGGASRFFYVAKADRAERENGKQWASDAARNLHPTVKPVALMQWLCRLVTPPGGTVLDPFTGSGSTGIAALREGFSFIGIEREAEYVEIARARIQADAPLFNVAAEVTA